MSILIVAIPLLGAAGLLIPGMARYAQPYGLFVTAATLGVVLWMLAAFDYAAAAAAQFPVNWEWIPGLGLRFHLGVDGISLPLVALTALLTFLCVLYGVRSSDRPRALIGLLLILEVGMIGTFLALDLLLFFVFFEIVLVPMYFLIAGWGGPGRRAAALKFILYTLLGSVILLIGILIIGLHPGGGLDMTARPELPRSVQVIAFLAVGLGLAVKVPMWPLHSWLPDAHTEAPTVGSVLLAGVLLKMGTYGFARIAIPLLPEGAEAWAPWLGALGVIGIVYGALACLAQRDLKRLIAFSSVGHMGFVLLGFATLSPVGINAALFGNIAHGLITGLLFFLVGGIKERYGTSEINSLGGGLLASVPRLGSLLTFAAVASLGLPGLAGFWGEMLALLGAYERGSSIFIVFMVFGGAGAVLTAAYFLVMLSRVTHGVPERTDAPGDVGAIEWAAWAPLVALTLLIGLWPALLLGLTNPVVLGLVG